MNDEFSDELIQRRNLAWRFLADRRSPSVPRPILDTGQPYAAGLRTGARK